MKTITEEKARSVKGGFHWHCWACRAGGSTKAGYLRHRQTYPLHLFISYWS